MDRSFSCEHLEERNVEEDVHSPRSKSPASLNPNVYVGSHSNYVKFELERARWELEAAEAMRRAADAKRNAARVLQMEGRSEGHGECDGVQVDEKVFCRLPVLSSGSSSLHNEGPKVHPSTSAVHTKTDDVSNLERLLIRMELPKCELPCFDGSPSQYVSFMRQFEEQVESRVPDEGQRLAYLDNYCRGEAKEAIKGCSSYPAAEGYRKARAILKELFGKRHLIVKSLLDDIVAPGLIQPDAQSLFTYSNKLRSCADTLGRLGFLADLNSSHTLDKVLSKLPRFISRAWVGRADEIYEEDREPEFMDLCEFVCAKSRLHRNRYSYLLNDQKPVTGTVPKNRLPNAKTYAVVSLDIRCHYCKGGHGLVQCPQFKAVDVRDRWNFVSSNHLCFVCLGAGHRVLACPSRTKCSESGCDRFHHPMLHQTVVRSKVLNASCQKLSGASGVSLGVVPVRIEGPKGSCVVSALLDSGADTSLIRKDLAIQLGLIGAPTKICISTPIGTASRQCTQVALQVKSLEGDESLDITGAYTVPSILEVDATRPDKESLSRWQHLDGVQLPHLPDATLGILIGLDTPEAHWVLEQRRGKKGEPFAELTPLGWVLRGPLDNYRVSQVRACAIRTSLQSISEDIRKLFDQEFTDNCSTGAGPSVEDQQAVSAAERSLELKNGHLCVGLPWRDDELKHLSNRSAALHRLNLLGNRLQKNPELKARYAAVIQRYLEKGYAMKVADRDQTTSSVCWYLPHHAVVNPRKPEKIRVVFDCAASFRGESLNGHLLQGPNLVSNLIGVLMRFRQRRVAVSADIEDMFLQVLVPPVDQDALRFLWWSEIGTLKHPEEFRLTVHPFGAVSSPFCASFALKKSATLFGSEYPPNISEAIRNSFYVDDCLLSVNDEKEALGVVEGLGSLLSRCGFRITKWSSNSREVLRGIPPTERSSTVKEVTDSVLPTQRMLGVAWNMDTDSFSFPLQGNERPVSRRNLLSQLAAVYDPLGWIGPFVLPMKLLFQDLVKSGIGWDEPLDPPAQARWQRCHEVLKSLAEVSLPRWYFTEPPGPKTETELHLFCDASEKGYGAVAYLRTDDGQGHIHCALVMAKSRVAPIKAITVPRLELAAAVLATELAKGIKAEIQLPLKDTIYWSDSAVALYYIRNEKSRFATFVANRVSKIRDSSSPSQWHHVAGKHNPADLASRGILDADHDTASWFNAPEFLYGRLDWASAEESAMVPPDEQLEFKTKAVVNLVSCQPSCNWLHRFSRWSDVTRWAAWMARFKQYLRIRHKGHQGLSLQLGPLKIAELRRSRHSVIGLVQRECFPQELLEARGHQDRQGTARNNSCLHKLHPVLIDGLLCVGGRLHWSELTESVKHPIILPANHPITDMIIRHYHELEGHVGATQVLSVIRKYYWILRGRATVRRVLASCITCRRESARPCHQLMGSLPIERTLSTGFAFAHVGVDYFGPLYVKRGRVEEKRYGCLFTCLNIRAVHIEVAHSLTTDSFLQALIRFMARRGQPRVIVSDNGSNFKGADTEIKAHLKEISQAKINQYLLERDIEWRFGPPDASHWGGVWERMIRSVRRILRVISRSQRITDESLATFLAEAERILNSRPLVPLVEDHRDLEVLTPNKLLLLRDNQTMLDYGDFPKSCVRFWRRIQLLADTFWKRWKAEYVSQLQERQKWMVETKNLVPGDMVLVVDEGVHRSQWPLGRVTEVFAGEDGLVRQVLVKTTRGTLRRDIRKLCWLEGVGS